MSLYKHAKCVCISNRCIDICCQLQVREFLTLELYIQMHACLNTWIIRETLMKPGIGRNACCTLNRGPCNTWLFAAKGVVVHWLNHVHVHVYTCNKLAMWCQHYGGPYAPSNYTHTLQEYVENVFAHELCGLRKLHTLWITGKITLSHSSHNNALVECVAYNYALWFLLNFKTTSKLG